MENKNDYQTLKHKYANFMYVEERNNKGHVIIALVGLVTKCSFFLECLVTLLLL